MVNDEFIGAGWAFPLRTNAAGGIALVTREREIEESIRLVLGTAYGERPMRPEFGCGLNGLLAKRANEGRLTGIRNGVDASWDPRADRRPPYRFAAHRCASPRGRFSRTVNDGRSSP